MEVYTVKQLSEKIDLPITEIYKAIRLNELESIREGRRLFISHDAATWWINRRNHTL